MQIIIMQIIIILIQIIIQLIIQIPLSKIPRPKSCDIWWSPDQTSFTPYPSAISNAISNTISNTIVLYLIYNYDVGS